MFVSHLERFDLFMALVACGFFLCEGFLCRTGIGKIKNQRKKTDEWNEKHSLTHRAASFGTGSPLFLSYYYFIAKVWESKEKLFASKEQDDDGPSEEDDQKDNKLFD
jgi:hypothetical protein